MSRGGAMPKTPAVGWVFLRRQRQEGVTVRWRRGETVAYVLEGKRVGDHSNVHVLDRITVQTVGWQDLAEVRLTGQRWLRQQ